MKKLLLTGASGLLGWNICKAARHQWAVHGVVCSAAFDIPGVTLHRLNLTDTHGFKKRFTEIQPDAVLHTAAITDANYCQQHPHESYSINVIAAALLAELCAERNIPFVFTSSDLVFDGKKGNYSEADEPNPVSRYGEQKAEAEKRVLKIYPQAAICRMPLMIGDGGIGGKGYLHSFLTKAKNGEPLKLFTDEYRSPLGGMSAAKGLLLALQKFKGIWHLGGRERLSRFQLGEKIAKAFGTPLSQLIPAKQSEMLMPAPRPADVSLDSGKAYHNGFCPETIGSELRALVKLQTPGPPFQWERGRR